MSDLYTEMVEIYDPFLAREDTDESGVHAIYKNTTSENDFAYRWTGHESDFFRKNLDERYFAITPIGILIVGIRSWTGWGHTEIVVKIGQFVIVKNRIPVDIIDFNELLLIYEPVQDKKDEFEAEEYADTHSTTTQ